MKFKPNREKIIAATVILIIFLYFTAVPALITDHGLTHNKTEWGFNVHGPTPFHEAYSVFTLAFVGIHALVIIIIYGGYYCIKELFFQED